VSTICAGGNVNCSAQTGAIRPRRSVSTELKQVFRRILEWVLAYEGKRLSRIALSELTDEQLADIGVTPSEARREAARPFWN
jgi:uncharacterized protein YjiS (DUF1127 family)